MRSIRDSFLFVFFFLLPKNCISCLVGRLASLSLPRAITLVIIKGFCRRYRVDVHEAEKPLDQYKTLQEFFTRKLKPKLRPISKTSNIIASPCDGALQVAHRISDGLLFQAKGRTYLLKDLLQNESLAYRFAGGLFATLYLSPRDYHRFHVPISGEIIDTIHVPGSLWPVNPWAVRNVRNLFCQNERVITLIKEPERNLLLAHIAVGATMVGKIELAYCDLSPMSHHRSKAVTAMAHPPISVTLGQDLGKFMFGSTIILLCEAGLTNGFLPAAPSSVRVGQVLARLA
ncbi:MAG TPA: archaetidylserine decarboxylase [Myxococcota bacterium]|nr:archaetidylserine decarboxylase [Myxococcota bacterium]